MLARLIESTRANNSFVYESRLDGANIGNEIAHSMRFERRGSKALAAGKGGRQRRAKSRVEQKEKKK